MPGHPAKVKVLWIAASLLFETRAAKAHPGIIQEAESSQKKSIERVLGSVSKPENLSIGR
jgi:hypothetical protein